MGFNFDFINNQFAKIRSQIFEFPKQSIIQLLNLVKQFRIVNTAKNLKMKKYLGSFKFVSV